MHDRFKHDFLSLLQFVATNGGGFGCKDLDPRGVMVMVAMELWLRKVL